MGQNNSQTMQLHSVSLQNWHPSHRDSNTYINQVSSEKAKRHFVRISIENISRQIALYSSRVNNNLPSICRILYFHPVNYESKVQQDQRQMYVYTEVLLPLAEWTREKILSALSAFRKLIQTLGPFKITEQMFFQTQKGEVKVWVNQSPISNHPGMRYGNEEQTLADFASIITKKNKNVANLILGSLNMRETQEKLTNPPRQMRFPHQNYSHRTSESGDMSKKKIQSQNAIYSPIPYRNVFGQTTESFKFKNQGHKPPKATIKHAEGYPQSSIPAQDQQINSCKKTQYKEYFYQDIANVQSDQKLFNRAKMNFINQVNFKTSQKSTDKKTTFQNRIHEYGSTNNFTDPVKPLAFQFQHRYETTANLGKGSSYVSQKKCGNQNPNLYSTPNNKKQTAKTNPDNTKQYNNSKQEIVKPFEFTIINNNVNNYVNNITHNHIVKIEKNQSPLFQFKNTEPHKFNPNFNTQFNHQKTKERSVNIPVFIQQMKKQTDNQELGSLNLINKSKSNVILRKNNQVTLNPQQQKSNTQEKYFVEVNANKTEKQQQTNLLINNNNTSSDHKFNTSHNYNNPYPKTPTPTPSSKIQTFGSFQKASNGNFELKVPLRTKTTEFYKGKEGNKDGNLKNKSFTNNQLEIKEADHHTQPLKEHSQCPKYQSDLSQKEINQQQMTKVDKKPDQKVDFKKQIKNQFQFLMGGESKERQKSEEEVMPTLKMQQNHRKQVKEGNLKDKIKKKQIVFAELKKEALKVLTDD